MALKLLVQCEYCGAQSTVESIEELADAYCKECDLPPLVKPLEPEPMSQEERKERYRRQYKANGYSWLGKEPTMWQGDLE